MQTRTFSWLRRAGRRAFGVELGSGIFIGRAKTVLAGWLVTGVLWGGPPSLEAAQGRVWFGQGDGVHWSDGRNWVPVGVPQSGEDLLFEITGLTTPTEMVNDLDNFAARSLTFKSSFQFDFFTTVWTLRGNEVTVRAGMSLEAEVGVDLDVTIDCAITLGNSMPIRLGTPIRESVFCHLNGEINLNGHNLEFASHANDAVIRINAPISGQGNVRFVSEETGGSPLVVFGGANPNTFDGLLAVERLPGARPFEASFDQPGGNVLNRGLSIGDGCEVSVRRADQIGDDAAVSVTGGGRLLFLGHAETLGSLSLTNVFADAEPTLVDATGTTLTLCRGITTSVFNENGNIPTIRGTLALSEGPHVFDLNNASPSGAGLVLPGPIVGQGGFSKFGRATLVLASSNAFDGPVAVHDGILEVQDDKALGTTAGGVTIADGTLVLRRVFILGETLTVRGTRPVTAHTAGSLLLCFDFGSWGGPVQLETNLVVQSTGQFLLGGPIDGPGGLELLGASHHLAGGGGSTYTGLVRSLCEVLTVTDERSFRGPLIVGGGSSPLCEVRWGFGVRNFGVPQVTVHTNGWVNLNGRTETFSRLIFHGGRVSTGTGALSVATVVVNPTNVVATIDGTLRFSAFPVATFEVADGLAEPDLSINAVVSDDFGGGLRKTGAGTMTLHRANTYSGRTLVEGGTLEVLNDQALGLATVGTTVFSGATVVFGAQADLVLEPFVISGFGVGGTAGALKAAGDVWINADLALSFASAIRTEGASSRIQVNEIVGTGPLTKLGGGRLVLRGSGPNTFSGETRVEEGVLDLAKPSGIPSVPGALVIGTTAGGAAAPPARVEHRANFTIEGSVTVNAGGLWDLNGASEDWLGADLQGRPPLTLNDGGDVQTGAGIFVLPAGGGIVVNPGSSRLGGGSVISGRVGLEAGPHRISVGAGGASLFGGPECNVTAALGESSGLAELEKEGGGTLRLAGTNTYRGATRVSGGALQVDGVQPQSAVRVLEAGRLQGAGTVGSIETVGPGATVAPGATPTFLGTGSGILTCGDFNAGAVPGGVLFVKLNGTTAGSGHDQINARGSVRLTGLALAGSLGFASTLHQQFVLINNDGADAVQGTFEGLDQNASLYLGGERFTISYTGGTGNDVVITRQVTPELVVTTLPAREAPNFALDFDGRFNRVHFGTNPFPAVANNFTIELWANPTAARTETAEANVGISDLAGQRHAVFPDHGDFGYGANQAGAGLSIGTNGVSVFEHAANYLPSLLVYSNAVPGWTHFALVYSNRQPRLYVNGALARIGQPSIKTVVHPSANLGGSIQGLTYGNFQGQLDEVRVWTGVRSQSQIQTNLDRSLTGSELGLLLYLRCEETNGVSVADSAPAAPNLTGFLLNGVASVFSGALPPSALTGPAATLNGLATPGGLDASLWFEWGATTNYGNLTATQSVSAVTRAAGVAQTLSGLAAGEYHFRAVGSNGLHFSFGRDATFTLLNGAPRLSIEKLSGSQVRLLWPTGAVGFTLEANVDLRTTNWAAAVPLPVVSGTNHAVINATEGGQRFYRLFKP